MAMSPQKAARLRAATDMRTAGASWQEIADACGWNSPQAAHKAVQKVLRDTLRESADNLRTLEAERLDRLLAGLWAKASTGDTAAVATAIRLMERRAKLLGIDAQPEKSHDQAESLLQSLVDGLRDED